MWVKVKIYVEDMSCASCEQKIYKRLVKLKGIKELNVSYKDSCVVLEYDKNMITLEQIENEIEAVGYTVKKQKGKNCKFLGIVFIIVSLFLVVENTIGFNFIPSVNQSMSYGMLFFIGLLTSVHCIAMCGGINLSQSIDKNSNEVSLLGRIKSPILYNTGRVISYTVIGGIVGIIGQVLSPTGFFKGVIALIAGLFMVIMGLNMLNIFPKLRKFNIKMPTFIIKRISKLKIKNSALYVGLLNGLMPCGPLQSMQIYALGTDTAIEGALSMMFFSLGTVPLMIGVGIFSTFLSKSFAKQMIRVGATLVLVLGVVMFNRGLNLAGVSTDFFNSTHAENIAIVQEEKQIVYSKISSGSYPTITVQEGIPVEWNIKVGDKDLNGCNNPITLPSYGVEKELEVGDNIISFTPEKEGKYVYTCWMGMISGTIEVVKNIE